MDDADISRLASARRGLGLRVKPRPVRRPIETGLLAGFMVLLYGLDRFDGADGRTATTLAIWIVTYIITIFGLIVERRRAAMLVANSLPIVAAVAMLVTSVAWSDFPDIASKEVCEMLCTTASAYLIVCRFTLREFLWAFTIGAGATAILSLMEVVAMPSLGIMQDEYAGAWQGIFNHKNALGQAMVFSGVTMMSLALSPETTRAQRMVLWALSALCGFLLFESQSVSSFLMLGFLAGILLALVLWRSRAGRRVLVLSVSAIASVCIIVGLNMDSLLEAVGRDATLTGRTEIWPVAIDAIAKRPLFGYGYNSFWIPDGTGAAHLTVPLEWTPHTAHNGFLELTLDVGLVGIVVFLIMFIVALYEAGRLAFGERDRTLVLVWPLIAVLFLISANITEANIAAFNSVNWVIFLIGSVYASDLRRRQSGTVTMTEPCQSAETRASERAIRPYVAPRSACVRLIAPRFSIRSRPEQERKTEDSSSEQEGWGIRA